MTTGARRLAAIAVLVVVVVYAGACGSTKKAAPDPTTSTSTPSATSTSTVGAPAGSLPDGAAALEADIPRVQSAPTVDALASAATQLSNDLATTNAGAWSDSPLAGEWRQALDVLSQARQRFDLPLAAYNVSGEYSMLKAAIQNGWLDGPSATLELLTGIKRAGADMIITYYAKQAARWIAEDA